MKGIILFLIVLIFTGDIYGFDYSAYKLRDLDEIIKESKAFEPEKLTGQSLLMPPHAVHLYVGVTPTFALKSAICQLTDRSTVLNSWHIFV